MEAIVFDSSAFMACLAPDESPPKTFQYLLKTAHIFVPALWPFEMMNSLLISLRRQRLSIDDIQRATLTLSSLDLEVESASLSATEHAIWPLAKEFALTVYDAAYLELASRRGLPLATLDEALRKAAKRKKVKLL